MLQKNSVHFPNSLGSIQSRTIDRFARMISAVETDRPKGMAWLNILAESPCQTCDFKFPAATILTQCNSLPANSISTTADASNRAEIALALVITAFARKGILSRPILATGPATL